MFKSNKEPSIKVKNSSFSVKMGQVTVGIPCLEVHTRRKYFEAICHICGCTYYVDAEKALAGKPEAYVDCPRCSGECDMHCNRDLCDLQCCFLPHINVCVDEVLITPADPNNRPHYFGTEAPEIQQED